MVQKSGENYQNPSKSIVNDGMKYLSTGKK